MSFQNDTQKAQAGAPMFKPAPGTAWQERKTRRAENVAHEQREMGAARKRDLEACHGCRWPGCEFMPQKPRLEVSHCFKHRGQGGNPDGDLTRRDLLMLMCFIHHDRVDGRDLANEAKVEATTDRGTDGPCAFYERNQETGRVEHVWTESAIGVSVAVGL